VLILFNTFITDSRVVRDESSDELRSVSAAAGNTADAALIGLATAWKKFTAFRAALVSLGR
jgi:hypothetical protein